MDADLPRVRPAHWDVREIWIHVVPASATLPTGCVVHVAEAAGAWIEVAGLALGEEAELGFNDDVEVGGQDALGREDCRAL